VVIEHLTDHHRGRDPRKFGQFQPEFGVALPIRKQVRRAPQDVDVSGRAELLAELDLIGRLGGASEFADRQRAVLVGDPGVGVAVVYRQRERRAVVVREVVLRRAVVVDLRLQEGETERRRDGVAERDTDQSAGIVAQASDRFGRDRAGRIDEIGLAFAVGGVVNADGFAVLEGLDRGLDAARGRRGITAVRQRPSPPFHPPVRASPAVRRER
jgi:hypothetical protein